MLFERLPAAFKTIRFRLAAWNAIVILLTAWAVLFSVRIGLHAALLDEMDDSLRDDRNEVMTLVAEDWDDRDALLRALNRKADSHIRRPWFAQFFDRDGREILASQNRPEAFAKRDMEVTAFPENLGDIRFEERHVVTPDGQVLDLRIGASIAHVRRRIQSIDFIGVVTTGIMLLVAPLAGFWLAGRATNPLADIIHTAKGIRAEEISERLPIRGSGDEIDYLSATINDLLDRLALYLKSNREFLANAAHELRSPLAAVHSAVEVSLGGSRTQEEYEQLLLDVAERTHSLTHLINQLLLLAETEDERLHMTKDAADLCPILRSTIEMFEPVAEMRQIRLSVSCPEKLFVRGDSRRLRQVAINLVDNALKFTPESGSVKVELSSDSGARQAVLVVRDTGMGIAPNELDNVFNRFYRSPMARRRKEGSGLGLSICSSIVNGCGGQITVASEIGRGSVFTVRLPLAPSHTNSSLRTDSRPTPTTVPSQ